MSATDLFDERYVSADEYVRLAGLQISGRSLQRWARSNEYLADRLGEVRLPGKLRYDRETAPRFREHWIAANLLWQRSRPLNGQAGAK